MSQIGQANSAPAGSQENESKNEVKKEIKNMVKNEIKVRATCGADKPNSTYFAQLVIVQKFEEAQHKMFDIIKQLGFKETFCIIMNFTKTISKHGLRLTKTLQDNFF